MKLKYAATVLLAGSSSGAASASSSCPCWEQWMLNIFLSPNEVYNPGNDSCAYYQNLLPSEKKVLCLKSAKNVGYCAVLDTSGGSFCSILTPDNDKLGDNTGNNNISEQKAEICIEQIKDKCKDLGYSVPPASSANQGKMKTFEQQVSVAQGKDTRAIGHAESKSNTELPECITLGFSGSTEGCTTYCTDNGLEFSDYAQIGDDGTVTCMCTKDGIVTNVCIKPPPGPNTAGEPCTNFGITDNQSCTDYCNQSGEWDTETDGKITSSSCACASIVGATTKPFSCTTTTSSSSAWSLLLPGVVVTTTTYLIAMGI